MHLKHQVLFSLKNNEKYLLVSSAAVVIRALRVNIKLHIFLTKTNDYAALKILRMLGQTCVCYVCVCWVGKKVGVVKYHNPQLYIQTSHLLQHDELTAKYLQWTLLTMTPFVLENFDV